jgi:hypothetical protein
VKESQKKEQKIKIKIIDGVILCLFTMHCVTDACCRVYMCVPGRDDVN